mmetsp:Transcript_31270/g.70249  ORF Transcript_31270/g.70249 Transcript_31270/m.70249 type:complete len:256 (+) Transcript_31270:1324-2091(+)
MITSSTRSHAASEAARFAASNLKMGAWARRVAARKLAAPPVLRGAGGCSSAMAPGTSESVPPASAVPSVVPSAVPSAEELCFRFFSFAMAAGRLATGRLVPATGGAVRLAARVGRWRAGLAAGFRAAAGRSSTDGSSTDGSEVSWAAGDSAAAGVASGAAGSGEGGGGGGEGAEGALLANRPASPPATALAPTPPTSGYCNVARDLRGLAGTRPGARGGGEPGNAKAASLAAVLAAGRTRGEGCGGGSRLFALLL